MIALDQTQSEKYVANQNALQAWQVASTNLYNSLYVQTLQGISSYYYDREQIKGEVVNYTNDDSTNGQVTPRYYDKYTANLDRINKEITDQTRTLSVDKAALADANKALTDAKASDTYKNLIKAVTDAQKKFDDAKPSLRKKQLRTNWM